MSNESHHLSPSFGQEAITEVEYSEYRGLHASTVCHDSHKDYREGGYGVKLAMFAAYSVLAGWLLLTLMLLLHASTKQQEQGD